MQIVPLFTSPIFVKDLNFHLKPIQKECIYKSKKDEGRNKSNVGGWQSNPLTKSDSFFSDLITTIELSAKEFSDGLQMSSNLKLDHFWININKFKDYNQYHTHPNSMFSGVYYIKIPENCGSIQFKHPCSLGVENCWNKQIIESNPFNSCVWDLEPVENRLLIFPSWLEHQVLPNLSREERISLSFNFTI